MKTNRYMIQTPKVANLRKALQRPKETTATTRTTTKMTRMRRPRHATGTKTTTRRIMSFDALLLTTPSQKYDPGLYKQYMCVLFLLIIQMKYEQFNNSLMHATAR